MLRNFNRNPWMFLQYYAITFFIFAVIDCILLSVHTSDFYVIQMNYWQLAMVPVGIFFGFMSAALIHNATHKSIKWARFWGEICGVHQLYGFMGWAVAHLLHHKYPDDPQRDPHPPDHLPFWKFVFGMRSSLRRCLKNAYLLKWGDTSSSRRIWVAKNIFAIFGIYARLLFWFLILGPVVFVMLYVPSLIANILFFAHFNYYTHRPTGNGDEMEIVNLSDGLYYRIVNKLFFGIYFHKNHHARPSYPNPMKL